MAITNGNASNGHAYPSAHTTTISNPRLRLLNKLKSGEKPLMTFTGIPSTRMGQVIAATGLDGIIVDCEHGKLKSPCRDQLLI